jgi:hypothetical protein
MHARHVSGSYRWQHNELYAARQALCWAIPMSMRRPTAELCALGKTQQVVWLNPVRRRLEILVALMCGDHHISRTPSHASKERPLALLDPGNGPVECDFPLRTVFVRPADMRNSLMRVAARLLINAHYLEFKCH